MINLNQPYKTVIVVRKDLALPPGKLAAQVAHAVLRVNLLFRDQIAVLKEYSYNNTNLPICIILCVKGEKQLLDLKLKVEKANIPSALQIDAGYNFVDKNTPTALCIGPAPEQEINILTKRLRLF